MSKRGIPINPAHFRAIRKNALLTQEELALKAKCSVDLIQKAERKGTLPRVDPPYLNSLLEVLGASLSDVIAEKESEDVTLAKEWQRLIEQGDLDALEQILSPSVRYEIPGPPIPLGEEFEPVTDGVYIGRAQVRAALATVFQVTTDRRIIVHEIHSVDDWVYLEGTFEWYAVALESRLSNHIITKMRFHEGQLTHSRSMTTQPLPDSQEALDRLRELANQREDWM